MVQRELVIHRTFSIVLVTFPSFISCIFLAVQIFFSSSEQDQTLVDNPDPVSDSSTTEIIEDDHDNTDAEGEDEEDVDGGHTTPVAVTVETPPSSPDLSAEEDQVQSREERIEQLGKTVASSSCGCSLSSCSSSSPPPPPETNTLNSTSTNTTHISRMQQLSL